MITKKPKELKHLVKKYVNLGIIKEGDEELINITPVDEVELAKIVDNKMDGYYAFAQTEDNKIVQTFKFEHDGKIFLIPEPDPIVIYFDSARHYHKTIQERKTELFSKLSTEFGDFAAVNGDFYWFFSNISSCVMFMFLSLEAFVNKSIPAGYTYKKVVQNKKTEIYDKIQIQREIDFGEKVKKVLPEIYNKNFAQDFSHLFDIIMDLKRFRDEIVHTKSFEGVDSSNFYEKLYTTSLSFDYDKVLFATRDFINYHQPNLIEECQCGGDY